MCCCVAHLGCLDAGWHLGISRVGGKQCVVVLLTLDVLMLVCILALAEWVASNLLCPRCRCCMLGFSGWCSVFAPARLPLFPTSGLVCPCTSLSVLLHCWWCALSRRSADERGGGEMDWHEFVIRPQDSAKIVDTHKFKQSHFTFISIQ